MQKYLPMFGHIRRDVEQDVMIINYSLQLSITVTSRSITNVNMKFLNPTYTHPETELNIGQKATVPNA